MEACREVFLNETNEHTSLAAFPGAFTHKWIAISVRPCCQSDAVFMVTQRLNEEVAQCSRKQTNAQDPIFDSQVNGVAGI
jgi:hypothetical protein